MDRQSFLAGTWVPPQTQRNQRPLGTHPPLSTTGPRPVTLIVDRFLLLHRERGASGHTSDQQDCEQELFHVDLHFDSWEVAFGASESHRKHNARLGPVQVYSEGDFGEYFGCE